MVALAARPLQAWIRRRQAQRKLAIKELHSTMIQIVPRVHLPNESRRDLRALIEIGDARAVIWSHIPQTTPLTPKQEVTVLTALIRDQITLTTIGQHIPPETRYPLEKNILKVATRMKQEVPMNRQPAIPHLPGLSVLGNISEFRSQRLDLLRRVQQECGDVGVFRVGVWPGVLLNAPNDIATVLVEHADAFEKTPVSRRYLRSVVGNGVIVREGAPHRQRRRLMAPAFQHRRIAGYAATMVDHTEHMQGSWADGQELDLADAMMRLTLWIAGTCLFHVDLRDATDEIGATITDLSHIAIEVANRLVPVPMSWPTPQNRRLRAMIERMDTTIYQLIADHRRGGEDHRDVLSMLLRVRDEKDGSGLSDHDVRDELVTLLVAGHETTATALAWSWYLLMQHPGVYQRVRDKVDQVIQGRQPTAEDLPNLPYTLQVFKEALRLCPPSWVILRQAREAVSLEKYHLPQGMRVAISPYTLHRNPASFPTRSAAIPTAGRLRTRPHYAYLPFGAGPHVCIGNHIALMEAQLILATFIQRVTFALVPGQQIAPEPLITLRPKGGIRVVVRRR